MSYTYRLHPLTKQDYDEAYEWYEDKQKGLGERFLKPVRKKIEEIVLHPEAYGSKANKKFREAEVDIFPYLVVSITQKSPHVKNIAKNNANQ